MIQLIILSDSMHILSNKLLKISSWSMDHTILKTKLLNGDQPLQLNDRTVVIGDIRGFTAFTENNDIKVVIELVTNFYKLVEHTVKEHNGFKPEFIGDEFITFFEDSKAAVLFSFDISKKLCHLLSKYGVSVGIGIEKGKILEGVIGGESSKKYTLIGRPINVASRLQAKAKSGEILVSETVCNEVKYLKIKERNDIKLRGVNSGFKCCQLCEYRPPERKRFSSKFEQVIDRFLNILHFK
jgi:class 3 adenylate cyclase